MAWATFCRNTDRRYSESRHFVGTIQMSPGRGQKIELHVDTFEVGFVHHCLFVSTV